MSDGLGLGEMGGDEPTWYGRLAKEANREKKWLTVWVKNGVSQVTDTCGQLWETGDPHKPFLWKDLSWPGRIMWMENLAYIYWLASYFAGVAFLSRHIDSCISQKANLCLQRPAVSLCNRKGIKETYCGGLFSSLLRCVKSLWGHTFCSSCGNIWGWIAESADG